jgi:hypothetical protein
MPAEQDHKTTHKSPSAWGNQAPKDKPPIRVYSNYRFSLKQPNSCRHAPYTISIAPDGTQLYVWPNAMQKTKGILLSDRGAGDQKLNEHAPCSKLQVPYPAEALPFPRGPDPVYVMLPKEPCDIEE